MIDDWKGMRCEKCSGLRAQGSERRARARARCMGQGATR